jgi:ketosteroid isomerase-like protein
MPLRARLSFRRGSAVQTMIERQETGVDAWFRAWGSRDWTALAAMYHPDALYERPDGMSKGVAQIVAYLKALAASAPDASATVEMAHFAKEAVTVEWTENNGPEADRVVDVFQVHNGRIVAQREYFDPANRLRRLAALALRRGSSAEAHAPQQDDPAATLVSGRQPQAQSPDGPALRIDGGPDRGLVIPLSQGSISIGRALDNQLVLRDPATSLHHLQLDNASSGLVAIDLESTNGTFVNGERIRQRRLADGDRLGIGQNSLLVIAPPAAAAG